MPKSLLVDFGPTLARMTTNILTKAGFEVTQLADCIDDRQGAEETDIILCEFKAGKELKDRIAQLREAFKFKDVPILLLGGPSSSASMDAASALGADDHYPLPLDPDGLPQKLHEMLRPAGSGGHIDVAVINPFISAAFDVFGTMIGLEITRKDLFLKKDHRVFGDISGVIGLSGEAAGSAVVSFPEHLARRAVSAMLGEEPDNVSMDDIRDGVGEIVNMIAGSAKAALVDTKYHFRLSLPTVVQSAKHEIGHCKGAPCIVVIFNAEGEDFALLISLAPNGKN